MKRMLTFLIAVTLMVSMTIISQGSNASIIKAQLGAADLDGIIAKNEYGTENTFNKENATAFPGIEEGPIPFIYYINWTEEALYIAIKVSLEEDDWGKFTPQFNFNPWNIIPEGKNLQGLLFSAIFTSRDKADFTLFNHDTMGKSGAEENINGVTVENIEYKYGSDGDATIMEFKLPLDLFRIKSEKNGIDASDKIFEDGQSFSCSAFLFYQGKVWGQTSGDLTSFFVESIGFGTITLGNEATPAPTENITASPDNSNNKDTDTGGNKIDGGAIAAIAVGVIFVASTVIYFLSKKKS